MTTTSAIVFACPGNAVLAHALAGRLGAEPGEATIRRFPDGETYVRIQSPVAGREVILACTLDRADGKLFPLLAVAATARDLGASRVGLVAPYLAYLRQDARFAPGEGVTSRYFAAVLGRSIDWLVTVDPHLHRIRDLGELYGIPAQVVHAAPLIAEWVRANVSKPLLIGPDSESRQWVEAVAGAAGAPCTVLEKRRKGDRDVEVSVPDVAHHRAATPVLVDDIISTARTMIATVRHLRDAGLRPPVCIGVHAVFADGAHDDLRAAGAGSIVTCSTIPHASNAIDVTAALAQGVAAVAL